MLEVDVTADTVQAVPHQNAAISPETATQIKYGSSRMPVSKTHERPIVFAWPGRYSGLVKIVAGTNHVLIQRKPEAKKPEARIGTIPFWLPFVSVVTSLWY